MGSPPRSVAPAPRPPPLLLSLLLLLLPALPAAAAATRGRPLPGRFGCLFEDDLCRPFEICVNDGVFGRCQQGPVIDIYQYEVSPPVLEHLRTILQKLSHRGFTWQDDYTQGTVAQELENIPKIHQWHPESLASHGVNSIRTSKSKIDNKRPSTLEKDSNLAKSLQQYLTYLKILARASTPDVYPRIKSDKAAVQNNIFPERLLNYIVQKTRGSNPELAYVPISHPNYPDNPSLRAFSQIQPNSFPYNLDPDFDKQNLIAALKAYMAQNMIEENTDKGSSGRTRDGPQFDNRFLSPYNEAFSKEEEMDVKAKPLFLLQTGLRELKPGSGMSVQKLVSVPRDAKDSLSTLDETLIQNVLKDLRKQQGDVDSLNPLELEKMADVITDAMQSSNTEEVPGIVGVEAEGEQREQEMKGINSLESNDYQNGLMVEDNLQSNRLQESDDEIDEKVKSLDTQLLGLDNERKTQRLPGGPPSEKPFKTETKKSEDIESSFSSEEENAGVENVKSETYSQELTAEKKPNADPDANEFVEFQDWMQGTLKEDEKLSEGPPKIPGEGLQLEVKSSDEEEYGYIVTEIDPLSVEKGQKLIEDVAFLLKLPPTTIVDVSVLGPAVTFKVSSSFQNMTTADVAKAAADNKDKLEKASGLKILRTGTGSVSDNRQKCYSKCR
ncbi:receptor-type tyrosine-protein phosphatase N2-like [Petaurus breviceps papuanus]|uniref:receptor-type tyrosine-protein phosphatase N2-like n=1 Tax=Petaurus breviceps papuanus TaxID=3040969 RepID=UPI0036D9A810